MTRKQSFEERYQSGTTPWELNRPDSHLIRIIEKEIVKPCRVLEIGCGTGSNAVFLHTRGFDVTAADFSSLAVEKAKEKARQERTDIKFLIKDFLLEKKAQPEFDFIFDRGCFHSFSDKKDRKTFAKNAARHLKPEGVWFSILGNADDPPRDEGPPMRSALDIVTAVEPFFEILSLVSDRFDSKRETPARCWLCLMRKR
ncbi:MAG: class I SAM-dependent methyltransferase [Desulfobacula sp.]|jgi:SAM-dependent methyltransferase